MSHGSRKPGIVAALALALAGCGSGASGGSGSDGGLADVPVDRPPELRADEPARLDTADAAADERPAMPTCVATGAPARTVRRLTTNNGAELAGDVAGFPDAIDPGSRRRIIPAQVHDPLPELLLGPAYLLDVEDSAMLAMTAQNVGSTYLCPVKAEKVVWRGADGKPVVERMGSSMLDSMYVHGEVGDLGAGYTVAACLAPGQLGYFAGIKLAPQGQRLYPDVASVELTLSHEMFASAHTAPGAFVPVDYHCATRAGELEVILENVGTIPVAVDKYIAGWMAFVDDRGLPVGWTFLDPRAEAAVAPGNKLTTHGFATLTAGRAVAVHAFASWKPRAGAVAATASPPAPGVARLQRELETSRREERELLRALILGVRGADRANQSPRQFR